MSREKKQLEDVHSAIYTAPYRRGAGDIHERRRETDSGQSCNSRRVMSNRKSSAKEVTNGSVHFDDHVGRSFSNTRV